MEFWEALAGLPMLEMASVMMRQGRMNPDGSEGTRFQVADHLVKTDREGSVRYERIL
jgi:hypothetical protein